MGRLVRPRGGVRGARRRDALPLRPLHLAGRRVPRGRPRRVDDHRGARGADDDAAVRHARLSRDVPRAGPACKRCRNGRPRLRRARRARARRRLDGARAPRVRLRLPRDAVRVEMFAEQLEILHRLWTEERVDFRGTPLHARGRARPAEARPEAPTSDHRRRRREARHRRARAPLRRRVQHAVRLRRRGGRDPGEDAAAALLRHDELPRWRDARRGRRARAGALLGAGSAPRNSTSGSRRSRVARFSARSTRSPRSSASTSAPAAIASCSST